MFNWCLFHFGEAVKFLQNLLFQKRPFGWNHNSKRAVHCRKTMSNEEKESGEMKETSSREESNGKNIK